MLTVVSVIALASAVVTVIVVVVVSVIVSVVIAIIVPIIVPVVVSIVVAVIISIVVTVIIAVVVSIVVTVVVTIMVSIIITNSSLIAVLRDTRSTQRNQGRRLLPLANTLSLGRIVVMHMITLVSDAHDRTADVPAASRDIVVVEAFAQSKITREHEAGEGKQVLDAHGQRLTRDLAGG